MLQHALMILLPTFLTPHPAATAFLRGVSSPLRRNAEAHAKNSYLARIDLEDFFPSITPEDLLVRLEAHSNPRPLVLSESDRGFVTNVCFVKYHNGKFGLPVGAPSSPLISNAVMFDLDVKISATAVRSDFTYTRYADDLVFSTMRKSSSKALVDEVAHLLAQTGSPRLKINERKTRFMSRNCRRAVTGLLLTPDGNLSIGRNHKRTIRSLVNSFVHGNLSDKQRASLQGWLAFASDSEPDFVNRLCLKYSAETINQALRRQSPSQE
jgi:retron-type reverse transcriptase